MKNLDVHCLENNTQVYEYNETLFKNLDVPDEMVLSRDFDVALSALVGLLFLMHNLNFGMIGFVDNSFSHLYMCPQFSNAFSCHLTMGALQLLSLFSSSACSFSFP